jgi:hypothetical protein
MITESVVSLVVGFDVVVVLVELVVVDVVVLVVVEDVFPKKISNQASSFKTTNKIENYFQRIRN